MFIFNIYRPVEECPFCLGSVDNGTPIVRLGEKECSGIQSANNNTPCQINVKPGRVVHFQCRKDFTRPSNKSVGTKEFKVAKWLLRADTIQFDFKSKCIFCATPAKFSPNSRKRSYDTFPVRTLDFQDKIIKICQERNDQWAKDIPPQVQSPSVCVVVDGGSLLQRIPWNKGRTYGEICKTYSEYLCRQYKSSINAANIAVVFDGYQQGPSTKYITHLRRLKGRVGSEVQFTIETPCRLNKDIFLSNDLNKQNFIFILILSV